MRVMNTFGSRLRSAREETGVSARALSNACGVSPSVVSFLERGLIRVPNANLALKLAQVLGVSVEWLVTGKHPVAEPGALPVPDREGRVV